jgi:hypothetical protein
MKPIVVNVVTLKGPLIVNQLKPPLIVFDNAKLVAIIIFVIIDCIYW